MSWFLSKSPLKRSVVLAALSLAIVAPARAQFISGSDGSDGAFLPVSGTVIDLSQAATGPWNMPSPNPGQGVYDPDLWVVVFKYTTINIVNGVAVTFQNHPSGAPVVWLATGDVNIQGTVDLNGQHYLTMSAAFEQSEPGPGGFGGGAGVFGAFTVASGFGPGGGTPGIGGAYSYGNPSIVPLIGGSGGGGRITNGSHTGGAGGGAILIASSGAINLFSGGSVLARGGDSLSGGWWHSGGGSGGAIRFVANTISGAGVLAAYGGTGDGSGGTGRIRLEAFSLGYNGSSNPPYTFSGPGPLFQPSSAPTLRAVSIDGVPVPTDPAAGVGTNDVIAQNVIVTLQIEAMNIPTGTTVEVTVRPGQGAAFTITSTPLAGSFALSTAQAFIQLPDVPSDIQLKANWTP